MLAELLNNAIKYAPGARITTTVRRQHAHTVIEIADSGPGLDPGQLPHLTARFWRAPEHALIRGTGMGLAIVAKLAAANGGTLLLDGNRPHGLRARLSFHVAPRPTDQSPGND